MKSQNIKFDPKNFTAPKAKPLPVFLILDVSTTMGEVIDDTNLKRTGEKFFKDGKHWEVVEGGISKMDLLNEALGKMLASFADEEKAETQILVSIITFGDTANLYLPPIVASEVIWENLKPDGETALGAALEMAKEMIEDKEITPSRAYRPTVVLVSDGQPNDKWEKIMNSFIHDGRSSKCDRMAMAIGRDADKNVLGKFIEGTPHPLFTDEEASTINEFFQRVTMSVTSRTRSTNPNSIPENSILNHDGKTRETKTENNRPSNQNDLADEGYW